MPRIYAMWFVAFNLVPVLVDFYRRYRCDYDYTLYTVSNNRGHYLLTYRIGRFKKVFALEHFLGNLQWSRSSKIPPCTLHNVVKNRIKHTYLSAKETVWKFICVNVTSDTQPVKDRRIVCTTINKHPTAPAIIFYNQLYSSNRTIGPTSTAEGMEGFRKMKRLCNYRKFSAAGHYSSKLF